MAYAMIESDVGALTSLTSRRAAITMREVSHLFCFRGKSEFGEDPSTSLFLFDPAEKTTFPSWASGFTDVYLKHGVDVPVGIGLSLSLAIAIIDEGRWRKLLDAAVEAYGVHRKELHALGIEWCPFPHAPHTSKA